MKIKTLIKGGNFSEYQHFVVMTRETCGVIQVGGGKPSNISRRFGDEKIKHISVYENIVRIEV